MRPWVAAAAVAAGEGGADMVGFASPVNGCGLVADRIRKCVENKMFRVCLDAKVVGGLGCCTRRSSCLQED